MKIGTYENIATASMSTPVIQVINMFVEQNISAVPIVDANGVVLNVYETIDVMVRIGKCCMHENELLNKVVEYCKIRKI